MAGSFHMIMIVLAAGLVAAVAAATVGWIPEAAGTHESYWVLEPHEQLVTGSRGEVASIKTTYVNRTYTVPHPPPPAAHLEGCQRTPGYIYWWHSNATHRLADPGYVPFMEYGVHYANSSSKVMPDLQARINATNGDVCITAVLAASGAPGGFVYAGEDVHGGTVATLHAVAGFLQDRGAVLEDYWDWDYGVEYPPVDHNATGGPYRGSEYPDLEFAHEGFVGIDSEKFSKFTKHQLKWQISARVPAALVDELAARPDVVAIDVYGKWVGTPEFMFYNSDAVHRHLDEVIAGGTDPVRIFVIVWPIEQDKHTYFPCPHRCLVERAAVEGADQHYDGMHDRHMAWLVSFIEDNGGDVTSTMHLDEFKAFYAVVPSSLVDDLDKLRIMSWITFSGMSSIAGIGSPHPHDRAGSSAAEQQVTTAPWHVRNGYDSKILPDLQSRVDRGDDPVYVSIHFEPVQTWPHGRPDAPAEDENMGAQYRG